MNLPRDVLEKYSLRAPSPPPQPAGVPCCLDPDWPGSSPDRCGNLLPDPPARAANLRPRLFRTWSGMSAACAPTVWPVTGERYREELSWGIAPAAGEDVRGTCTNYDGQS